MSTVRVAYPCDLVPRWTWIAAGCVAVGAAAAIFLSGTRYLAHAAPVERLAAHAPASRASVAHVTARPRQAPASPDANYPGYFELEPVEVLPSPDPFAELSDDQLFAKLVQEPEKLGTASIGTPNRGGLMNGIKLPERPFWDIRVPHNSYATPGVVASLERAVSRVAHRFADTPRLGIGDISREGGGYLRPHRSHQSGMDVDLGYYYLGGYGWYKRATKATLDRARTWALVEALIAEGDVEYIFIDRSVQLLLIEHARSVGVDEATLVHVFGEKPLKRGIVKHTWGHDDHIHVRFYDREARLRGQRLYPLLKRAGRMR